MTLNIDLSSQEPQFKHAFEILDKTQDNIFISGKAGTGKSSFLDYFKENSKKKMAILAPTGVAALNIKGQTIHSFFKFRPRFIAKENIKVKAKNKIYKKLELLVIDEISMVRADIFDAIEYFLRLNGPKTGEPFGGVQICVIGDLFQLPPIVSYAEREIFFNFYQNSFFFASNAYQMANFGHIEFKKIYRQSEEYFIRMLNAIRQGNINQKGLDFINKRCVENKQNAESSITLTTTNKVADTINQQKLKELATEEFSYKSKIIGDFNISEDKLPAPEKLILKVGAQIMFTRNHIYKNWVNGTIGKVVRLKENEIIVEVKEDGVPRIFNVKIEVWESISYELDSKTEKIKEKVKGQYFQYPLIPAWAITIHKSQGKTLDDVVIDLGNGAFASGQLYVALSRCRKFEKISLKRKIGFNDIKCDPNVIEFHSSSC